MGFLHAIAQTFGDTQLITAEQFLRIPVHGEVTELVDGRIVQVPFLTSRRGMYLAQTFYVLSSRNEPSNKYQTVYDVPVNCRRDPDTVRIAYVSLYQGKHRPTDCQSLPKFSPDVVFEVFDVSQPWSDRIRKIADLLDAGVTAVVVIDPDWHHAFVFRMDRGPQRYDANDRILFQDIVEGFCPTVAELIN